MHVTQGPYLFRISLAIGTLTTMIDVEKITAWIVDDDQSIRWVLQRALEKAGMQTQVFSDAAEMLRKFKNQKPNIIITDIRMPGMSGLELLENIHQAEPKLPVIVITAHSDLDTTVAAYQGGAFEYLPKPFDVHDVVEKTLRACQQYDSADEPESNLPRNIGIIGDSAAMQEVYRIIGRLSNSSIDALINGESGTGKELVAQALHEHSPRAEQPFIALNVAAIPAELMESELFGHEKGAFTGALERRPSYKLDYCAFSQKIFSTVLAGMTKLKLMYASLPRPIKILKSASLKVNFEMICFTA